MLVSFDHVLEKGIFNEVCRKYLEEFQGSREYVRIAEKVAIIKEDVMQVPLNEFVLVNEKQGAIRWELYRRYLECKNMRCIEIYWRDCELRVSDNGTARMYNEEVQKII